MIILDIRKDKVVNYIMAFLYKFLDKSPHRFINATFLQKAIFFLSRGIPILEQKLNFKAHKYGPHSYKLEEYVIDTLVTEDLLDEEVRSKDKIYSLTEDGVKYGKEAFYSLSSEKQKVIEWIVEQLSDITLNELLALVYYSYNDMTKYSEIKRQIDAKRVELAIKLYRKGKISFEKATEIAGISKEELRKLI